MKNDIYSMLNDADINLDDYKREDFNFIEKKKFRNSFRKSINKKHSLKWSIAVSAAVISIAVLAVGIIGSGTNAASALSKAGFTISSNIASLLGIQKNIDKYKTVVNKAVTNKLITAKLNEVVLDGKELTVSCSITSDKKLNQNESWDADNEIYINGQMASYGAGGSARNIDDYTTLEVMTYNLDNIDLKGDLDVKISCSAMRLNDNKIKGSWDFEFKTNGDQLKTDTKELLLNKSFALDNDEKCTLTKYTDNKLGPKIYALIDKANGQPDYDIILKGTDDLGNVVTFDLSHVYKGEALFKLDNLNGNLDVDAKTLTLTPYAVKFPSQSGKLSNDYKQAGMPFIIDLTKMK